MSPFLGLVGVHFPVSWILLPDFNQSTGKNFGYLVDSAQKCCLRFCFLTLPKRFKAQRFSNFGGHDNQTWGQGEIFKMQILGHHTYGLVKEVWGEARESEFL